MEKIYRPTKKPKLHFSAFSVWEHGVPKLKSMCAYTEKAPKHIVTIQFFFFIALFLSATACFVNDSFSFLTFSFFSDLSWASSTYFTVSLEVSNWFGSFALPLPWPWPLPLGPVGHIRVGSLIKSANRTTKSKWNVSWTNFITYTSNKI